MTVFAELWGIILSTYVDYMNLLHNLSFFSHSCWWKNEMFSLYIFVLYLIVTFEQHRIYLKIMSTFRRTWSMIMAILIHQLIKGCYKKRRIF